MAVLIEPLLTVRRVLREQITVLHRRLLAMVRDDDVCRRLMTVAPLATSPSTAICATTQAGIPTIEGVPTTFGAPLTGLTLSMEATRCR
jgi:transposase